MPQTKKTTIDEHLLLLLRSFINKPRALVRLLRQESAETLVRELGRKEIDRHQRDIERDLRWLESDSHHLLLIEDEDYPSLLRETEDAPPALWLDGDRQSLRYQQLSVAIVGSRKASRYGRNRAIEIATQLAGQNIVVNSGLALGIDAAAHEGVLEADGITCAVLGTGCDEIYPKRHWRLAERIREKGLIMSEFPPGTPAYPGHFPRRNRIITGLSQAVIVVEAALRSGSLVSARLALAQGREVMAVPGPVTHANAKGCHQLIRDGAALVESAEDILRELGLLADTRLVCGAVPGDLTEAERALLTVLVENPLSIDELVMKLGYPVDEITVNLVSLEVLGLIYSEVGIYHAEAVSLQGSLGSG